MKKVDMKGTKIGSLTVIDEVKDRWGWKSICDCDCGNKSFKVYSTHLRQKVTTHCGCKKPKGATHHQWSGHGDISGDFWYSHIVRSANGEKRGNQVRKPKELGISISDAWNLFIEQDGKCALSGLKLRFPRINSDKDWTASLDRIDSSKGYVIGNIQWVHKHINIMKNKFDNQYFIDMCKAVTSSCAVE